MLKFVERQANMAIQVVVLITIVVLASSVKAQKTCNETQCKLLPVGKEVASRFQTLVAEKGVKMIYLDLKIGNDGYHPLDSNERFFGKRWVWGKTISEPMLLLSEEDNEFEIYSLGLLKYQVRHFTVHLEQQPPGCLAHFNPHCQDYVVGKTLLVEFVKGSSGNTAPADCMCTLHIVNSASLKYTCCSVQNYTELNDPIVRCGPLADSNWFQTLYSAIYVFTAIFMMYCSAIPLLFPDFLFNLKKECEKETKYESQTRYQRSDKENALAEYPNSKVNKGFQSNDENQITSYNENEQRERTGEGDNKAALDSDKEVNPEKREQEAKDYEIPLDDASPITFGALLSDYMKTLPDFQINFNLKMLFLSFIVFPFFLYLRFALIVSYRLESYNEFAQKFNNCQTNTILEFVVCFIVGFGFTRWEASFLVIMHFMTFPCWLIVFVILLFIRPKDFFYHPQPKDCIIVCQSISLGDEMIRHLKLLHHWAYDLTFFVLKHSMDKLKQCLVRLDGKGIRRWPRVFRSMCYLLITLVGMLFLVALGAIFISIHLTCMGLLVVCLSPLFTFFMFIVKKHGELATSCDLLFNKCVLLLGTCLTFTPVVVMIFSVTLATMSFIVQICFFTVIGFVLNAGLLTPYAAFILVVTSNMYLCYSNFQARYKEVKQMISEHWKENKQELPCIGHIHDDAIPKELFWFVCGKGRQQFQQNVLSLRAEICFMLRDMALISTFLFASLLAILTFTSMNDISTLISTIIVFISGAIPSLILKGFTKSVKLSGWKKITMERKVKLAVERYIIYKKRNAKSGQNSGPPPWFFHFEKGSDFDS